MLVSMRLILILPLILVVLCQAKKDKVVCPLPENRNASSPGICNAFEVNRGSLERLRTCKCWYGDLVIWGRQLTDQDFKNKNTPRLIRIFGKLLLKNTQLSHLPFPSLEKVDDLQITSNNRLLSLLRPFRISHSVNVTSANRLCYPRNFIKKLRKTGIFNDNQAFCEKVCPGGVVSVGYLNELPEKCEKIEGNLTFFKYNGPSSALSKFEGAKKLKGSLIIKESNLKDLDFFNGLERIECKDKVCIIIEKNPDFHSISLPSLKSVRTKGDLAIEIKGNPELKMSRKEMERLVILAGGSTVRIEAKQKKDARKGYKWIYLAACTGLLVFIAFLGVFVCVLGGKSRRQEKVVDVAVPKEEEPEKNTKSLENSSASLKSSGLPPRSDDDFDKDLFRTGIVYKE